MTLVIVGGGAAGFFGAIACAAEQPGRQVILLEKTKQVLSKVRISGGGRCNVTHACFDPPLLVKHYPRGEKELCGPFNRFGPRETIEWFAARGVLLKEEEDGRMFPTTDSSETIRQCLIEEASLAGVDLRLGEGVEAIHPLEPGGFALQLTSGETFSCQRVLIATGSVPKMYPLLERLGHRIVPLVPSLFTFNLPTSPFLDLAGVAVNPVTVCLPEVGFEQTGPLLLTHWGVSGPAVLKLSAWAARALHEKSYQTHLKVNWLPGQTEESLRQLLVEWKSHHLSSFVATEPPVPLPRQLWRRLVKLALFPDNLRWAAVSRKQLGALLVLLRTTPLLIEGKTTYKQEFVTCGGVSLDEVNFKTMGSRLCPGLFFAGEVLNIDGITGGFNFQNAWTTGWIAGKAMASEGG